MGWWTLLGAIAFALFWGSLLIVVCWLATRAIGTSAHDSAFDIARQRYARGAISREEFETMRQDLQG